MEVHKKAGYQGGSLVTLWIRDLSGGTDFKPPEGPTLMDVNVRLSNESDWTPFLRGGTSVVKSAKPVKSAWTARSVVFPFETSPQPHYGPKRQNLARKNEMKGSIFNQTNKRTNYLLQSLINPSQ